MAAARVFAINAGTVSLVPAIGGAAIFSSTGVKLASSEANDSFEDFPILYATGINATAFNNVTYQANGEQSWDTLLQIEEAFPEDAKVRLPLSPRDVVVFVVIFRSVELLPFSPSSSSLFLLLTILSFLADFCLLASLQVNGTFTNRVNTTVASLEALGANYSATALPSVLF
jgi:hypothetical protein